MEPTIIKYALDKGLLALAISLVFNGVFLKIILALIRELKTGLIILAKQSITVEELSRKVREK